jgi:predicted O-methyltransferase YrrM
MELAQEYAEKYPEILIYLEDLKQIIVDHINETEFEGNCFYHHQTVNEYPELYNKQLNLFWCGKQAKKICEIGFNAGHSAMLLLLSSTADTSFTIFDIDHHKYTRPCLDYLVSAFRHVSFEYNVGDSTIVMPEWIASNSAHVGSFDLVHVDGGHTEACAASDMKYADILLRTDGIMVIDDTDAPQINHLVDQYISSRKYEEIYVLKTFGYIHRIIRKV